MKEISIDREGRGESQGGTEDIWENGGGRMRRVIELSRLHCTDLGRSPMMAALADPPVHIDWSKRGPLHGGAARVLL